MLITFSQFWFNNDLHTDVHGYFKNISYKYKFDMKNIDIDIIEQTYKTPYRLLKYKLECI